MGRTQQCKDAHRVVTVQYYRNTIDGLVGRRFKLQLGFLIAATTGKAKDGECDNEC